MRRIKKEKGITLIALIITIIVLLILAGVAINAVNAGNLFAHANNATTAYASAAETENSLISSYLTMMENYGGAGNTGSTTNRTGTEYYSIIIENTDEYVYVIDYDNNRIDAYYAEAGENLSYQGGASVTIVNAPFTVHLDDVETTITNGTGIATDQDGEDVIVLFIQNQRLYEGEYKVDLGYTKFESEAYLSLDTNFDTSRLVEGGAS